MMQYYPYYHTKKPQSNEKPEKCNNCCNELILSKAILKCNKSFFGPINPTFNNIINDNLLIASVTIDTTHLHCPTTLINFSGILTSKRSFPLLTFTLFKTCNNIRKTVTTFAFNPQNANNNFFADSPKSHAIKFKYLSCDDCCDDCCTYTLELTRYVEFFSGAEIYINGMISALAVDSQH